MVRLHDLADAFYRYKENKHDEKIRRLIIPIENCLEGIRGITMRDTAVDAICHGAPLAVPGVIAVPERPAGWASLWACIPSRAR